MAGKTKKKKTTKAKVKRPPSSKKKVASAPTVAVPPPEAVVAEPEVRQIVEALKITTPPDEEAKQYDRQVANMTQVMTALTQTDGIIYAKDIYSLVLSHSERNSVETPSELRLRQILQLFHEVVERIDVFDMGYMLPDDGKAFKQALLREVVALFLIYNQARHRLFRDSAPDDLTLQFNITRQDKETDGDYAERIDRFWKQILTQSHSGQLLLAISLNEAALVTAKLKDKQFVSPLTQIEMSTSGELPDSPLYVAKHMLTAYLDAEGEFILEQAVRGLGGYENTIVKTYVAPPEGDVQTSSSDLSQEEIRVKTTLDHAMRTAIKAFHHAVQAAD